MRLSPWVHGVCLAVLLAAWPPAVAARQASPQLTQVFPANAGTLGAIPDGGGVCPTNGAPRDVTFTVSGMTTVTAVSLTVTMTHTFVGDLTATLIAPNGVLFVPFGRTGATTATAFGDSSNIGGSYTFNDDATGGWWAAAAATADAAIIPVGAYRTSQLGGAGSTGATTSMNPAFAGVPGNGTWTLRFVDGCASDTGSVTMASLTLTDATGPPTAVNDSYAPAFNTPLVVAAPGVLGNDDSNGGGSLTAAVVTAPTQGTLSLNSNGSFTYTPNGGHVGADSFTYRATNSQGSSDAFVSVVTAGPTAVQPPYNLRVEHVSGKTVTLRWDVPSIGPQPTQFVVEGGVNPGEVLASLPTGSSVPLYTFAAPTGSFHVRLRSVSGAQVSGNSNEVPLYVNVPLPPSPPAFIKGVVQGTSLALSWKRSFGGGEPTGALIEVSGAANATIPIGNSESFVAQNVPPGSYTIWFRQANAAGVSNRVGVLNFTIPTACTAGPVTPANLLAYRVGNEIRVVWDPAISVGGGAITSYMLTVTGSYNGAFQTAGRALSGVVGPGTYNLSLTASNMCGTSPATPVQTVTVP